MLQIGQDWKDEKGRPKEAVVRVLTLHWQMGRQYMLIQHLPNQKNEIKFHDIIQEDR